MKQISKTIFFIFFFLGSLFLGAQGQSGCKNLISNKLPWWQRMAETIMLDYPLLSQSEGEGKPKWEYTYGLLDMSFLCVWRETGDIKYYNYAHEYVDSFINEKGKIATYKKSEYNIDKINPGKVLFTFYKETGEQKYKIALDTLRQQLREHPRTKAGGFWHKKRYENQMWLDGLYMGAPFYAQYAKEYNEPESFNDIGRWIVLMEKVARDTQTGLLYHGWDESKQQKWANPQTGVSPNFWGRGMGWYGMALVDVLDFFPENNVYRDSILLIINRMAEAIIKVQDTNTGLWYQVLDQGNREGNYLEGSVSSMFTYFLLKAVDKGYIDKEYLENGDKAYTGILKNMISVKDDGRLVFSPICSVAGLGGNPYRDGSYEYYVHEKTRDNDTKAVGPFIMAGIIYDRLKSSGIKQ